MQGPLQGTDAASSGRARKDRLTAWVLLPVPVLLTAVQLALPPEIARWYSDLMVPVALGAGLLLGIFVLGTNRELEFGRLGFYFSALLGLWFSAEVLFSAFDFIYGVAPEVSVADVLFLAGYVPPISYFITTLSGHRKLITSTTILLTLVIWGGVSAATLHVLVSAGSLAGLSPLAQAVTVLYPVLDLVLILFLLLVVPVWARLGFRTYWALIFVALVCVGIADLLYYYQRGIGTYSSGGFTDAAYLLGYSFLMCSFVLVARPDGRPGVPAAPGTGAPASAGPGPARLPGGSIYLVPSPDPDSSFGLFVGQLREGRSGLCITRTLPAALRRKHPLGETPVLWLSHQSSPESIDPFRMELVASTISDFLSKNAAGTVWVDGIEYLVTQNGFVNVLKWVQRLRDQVAMHDAAMLLALNPQAFEARELSFIQRETKELPKDVETGPGGW